MLTADQSRSCHSKGDISLVDEEAQNLHSVELAIQIQTADLPSKEGKANQEAIQSRNQSLTSPYDSQCQDETLVLIV